MTRVLRAAVFVAVLPLQACLASTVVLHVRPDNTGQAIITTRLSESAMRAFDAMFAGGAAPTRPPNVEEELPPPGQGELARVFGARVRIASSKLDKFPDGGVRTTIVEFDDVTQLQMMFPPVFMTAGQSGFGAMTGVGAPPLVRFAIKRHENGDRLLTLTLPNPPVSNAPDEPVTVFKTDSPEEQLFKRAIKGMSLKFSVEIELPLLRTNAPKQDGNRATILDLDLDKMINAMDEPRVRRMMSQGSFQEMLWQVGDLPGAVVPTENEIFLEFEGPPQAPAAAPAPQAPPDTDIFLAPLKSVNGAIEIGAPVNVTSHPSYDNQPFFTPDGRGVLFTSARGAAAGDTSLTRTDIYRYDLASRSITRVTQTPVGEYSPTVTPDGARISHIRTEADGTQRLASVPLTGGPADATLIVPDIKPVGYHAWADDHTVALFILGTPGGNGAPATLQVADTRAGTARVVATDIGRSLQRMPGAGAVRHVSFVQRERTADAVTLTIKELNAQTGEISVLTRAVDGAREADTAWTPDGTLLMANGGVLYSWVRGQSGWKEVASLERLGLRGVTRLAVSPKGDFLALVGSTAQAR